MKIDGATWRQWVDLDLEGELGVEDKARLDEIAAAESEVRAERRALESLARMIEDDRLPVRPGFTERVMAALPAAWWERHRSRAGIPGWALPLAMMLALALGAALALGSLEGASRFAGLGMMVVDFMAVTLLAGAGMLFATWRGVGFGLEQLFADSGLNLLALAIAVLFLNLLFFSMLRRQPKAAPSATDD